MTTTSHIEIQELLQKLEKDPSNLDLINSLAISYFENYDEKTDKEDFDYFEKAYKLKKTVKSTHNFAWFLYFEWSEIEWRWKQNDAIERALQIQKECIGLNPTSYYPYYLYGYMLLDQKKFEEAIPFLEQAWHIEKRRDILHNIAYCYFQLDEFQKAKELFTKSATQSVNENRSLYNLALTELRLNNREEVQRIADSFFNHTNTNFHETISGYEIGLFYFLIDDFQKASECLVKQGIDNIDLMDWSDLSYSLYKTDNRLWKEKLSDSIDKRKQWCKEIESNHEEWSEYSKEEKKDRLKALKAEIKLREEILNNGMDKPSQDLRKKVIVEHCGCLLFDCKRHGNVEND